MNIWHGKQLPYTGTDADKLTKLLFNAGSSGFMADGFEAWSDWRRFDIPKLEVGPVCTTIDHPLSPSI